MKFSNMKAKALIIGTICIGLAVAGITYALLSAKSNSHINDFKGFDAKVNISVIENGRDHEDEPNNIELFTKEVNTPVRKVVRIKNLTKETYQTTDTYVRVKLIPSIVNDRDNQEVLGQSIDIDYTYADTALWTYDSQQDVYYYMNALAPGAVSENLIEAVSVRTAIPDGYHLELAVLADGISADPIQNLKDAWKLTSTNDNYFADFVPVNTLMK